MTDRRIVLGSLLIDLEAELRRRQQWSEQVPDAAALLSEEPFCLDTLNFDQWLQFVFLPTLHHLLDSGGQLPEKCGVAPMAEEHFRGATGGGEAVVACLRRIDDLLSC